MIPTGASTIGTAWFLDGLANLQQRQTQTQKQLSTGFQVTTAADSPSQTSELVALEATLSSVQSYQTNLGSVQAEAQLADTALGNATSLIDSARSLAAEGANTVTTAAQRQSLATQIQGIQEQLVTIANSASAGRYIFGGDQDQTAPYRFTYLIPQTTL